MSRQGLDLAALLAVLDQEQSVTDLRRYFGVGQPNATVSFTGGRFELLCGGGDSPARRDVITADDLIAVELLKVQVPSRVSINLLEGDLGRQVAVDLERIPTDVALEDGGAVPYIVGGGPADRAWHLLEEQPGVGWVIAGKLLARKRPKLIPVYDNIVRCAYRTGDYFWCWLHGRLTESGGALAGRLAELRKDAGLSEEVSLLRILDVVFWMRHCSEHTTNRCRGLAV